MNLGFIGLGVMGFPMAGHLLKTGFKVSVYNRTTSKAEQWSKEYTGDFYKSPKELAENSDVVFICAGNDNDVLEIVEGENGILAGIKAGSYVIDHTTTSSKLAKKLYDTFKQHDVYFLDAPVSGGQSGAENGQLSTMVGGDQEVYDHIKPLFDSYCKSTTLIGNAGAGQLAKMANQLCIAGTLQGLSEALRLAQTSDLDIEKVFQAIKGGAAQSWQMDNRMLTMGENKFDFGFAIDWMIKDLAYALDQAEENNLNLTNAKHVLASYQQLTKHGESKSDTSVLVKSIK